MVGSSMRVEIDSKAIFVGHTKTRVSRCSGRYEEESPKVQLPSTRKMLEKHRLISDRRHLEIKKFSFFTGADIPVTSTKQTPWPLVRKRTMPTDRPPLVDEI
jgi:hypothetical protein